MMRKFYKMVCVAGLFLLFTGCGHPPQNIGVKPQSNPNVVQVRTGNGISDFEVHFIKRNGKEFAVAATREGVSIIQIQEKE